MLELSNVTGFHTSQLYLFILCQLYEVGEYEDGTASISITLPRSEASGVVNNKKEIYTFRSAIYTCTCVYVLIPRSGHPTL